MEIRRRHGIPSPLKAIRQYCLACTGGSTAAVKNCGITKCLIWPYRFGRNPKGDDLRAMDDESKEKLVEHRDSEDRPPEEKEPASPEKLR